DRIFVGRYWAFDFGSCEWNSDHGTVAHPTGHLSYPALSGIDHPTRGFLHFAAERSPCARSLRKLQGYGPGERISLGQSVLYQRPPTNPSSFRADKNSVGKLKGRINGDAASNTGPKQDLTPRSNAQRRQTEGQRQTWQSHRNRGSRRLARWRHRASQF